MPVASQDSVVWTFTVTVMLVGPSVIEGGTGVKENICVYCMSGQFLRYLIIKIFKNSDMQTLELINMYI